MAAIQIAAAASAQVVGTAGSVLKRAHLRSSGALAAVSSRSMEYAETFAHPQQRPNIVLNSLTSPGVGCTHDSSVLALLICHNFFILPTRTSREPREHSDLLRHESIS